MVTKKVECLVCSGNGCNAYDGSGTVEEGSQVDKVYDEDESGDD